VLIFPTVYFIRLNLDDVRSNNHHYDRLVRLDTSFDSPEAKANCYRNCHNQLQIMIHVGAAFFSGRVKRFLADINQLLSLSLALSLIVCRIHVEHVELSQLPTASCQIRENENFSFRRKFISSPYFRIIGRIRDRPHPTRTLCIRSIIHFCLFFS
jgi:hypothetical protein